MTDREASLVTEHEVPRRPLRAHNNCYRTRRLEASALRNDATTPAFTVPRQRRTRDTQSPEAIARSHASEEKHS